MNDLSFLDKLKVLVDVSSSSGLCIASIFILIFLAIIMLTTSKRNAKQTKIFYALIYIALIIVLFIQYGSSFSKMFDYMMNNLFIIIYFPNLAVYLAAIIAANIILWKTIFNFKEDKLLKVINTIIYSIMIYLLVLIMNVVTSSGIDVFDNSSVYSNKDALALIGLSSTIFMLWIIFIIVYKIIRGTQKNKESETVTIPSLPSNIVETAIPKRVREIINYKEINTPILPKNILEIVAPKEIKEVVKYKEVITPIFPKNIVETVVPKKVKEVVRYKDISKSKFSSNIIEIDIPKVVKDMRSKPKYVQNISEIEKYENMLTLEDYKRVIDILKNNTTGKDTTITIDNNTDKETINETKSIIENNINSNNIEYTYDYNSTRPKTVLDELLNL